MNELLPIIRRKRRPLLPVEAVLPVTAVTNDAVPKQGVTPKPLEKLAGKKGKSNETDQ
jgi:hypothetical protein